MIFGLRLRRGLDHATASLRCAARARSNKQANKKKKRKEEKNKREQTEKEPHDLQ